MTLPAGAVSGYRRSRFKARAETLSYRALDLSEELSRAYGEGSKQHLAAREVKLAARRLIEMLKLEGKS